MEYLEPYAKEKNILQLPIFHLSKPIPKKAVTEWRDVSEGVAVDCRLTAISDYPLPGAFEQDVYTACMRIWVEQDMPKGGIEVSYSQIARKLNLSPPKDWVGKIKTALRRLGMTRYEFSRCFVDVSGGEPERIDAYFSLFDSAHLFDGNGENANRRTGKSKLYFPQELRANLEAKYYQMLDLAWYKSLPSGLPRRLYEYLAKRRYHEDNGCFRIAEEILCRWLPVNDANVTHRRKTLEAAARALIDAGFLKSYHFDRERRQCRFEYSDALPKVIEATEAAEAVRKSKEGAPDEPPEISRESVPPEGERKNAAPMVEAVLWLKSVPYLRSKPSHRLLGSSNAIQPCGPNTSGSGRR